MVSKFRFSWGWDSDVFQFDVASPPVALTSNSSLHVHGAFRHHPHLRAIMNFRTEMLRSSDKNLDVKITDGHFANPLVIQYIEEDDSAKVWSCHSVPGLDSRVLWVCAFVFVCATCVHLYLHWCVCVLCLLVCVCVCVCLCSCVWAPVQCVCVTLCVCVKLHVSCLRVLSGLALDLLAVLAPSSKFCRASVRCLSRSTAATMLTTLLPSRWSLVLRTLW